MPCDGSVALNVSPRIKLSPGSTFAVVSRSVSPFSLTIAVTLAPASTSALAVPVLSVAVFCVPFASMNTTGTPTAGPPSPCGSSTLTITVPCGVASGWVGGVSAAGPSARWFAFTSPHATTAATRLIETILIVAILRRSGPGATFLTVLDGLFVTPAVTAITEALASAATEGRLAVVGNLKLARALGTGRDVISIGLSARAAKKVPGALPDTSTIEPASLAAVIGVDIARDEAWDDRLRAWSRVVRDGGVIVLVDRGRAAEVTRRALCAGLSELEQRHAGRAVITSGLVTQL